MGSPSSDLLDFPRPTVAVDLVILTLVPGSPDRSGDRPGERPGERPGDEEWRLAVVVLPGAGRPRLPGRFVRERQTVRDTVSSLLEEKLSFRPRRGMALDMIDVFDDPRRDARGWVMSLAYATTVRPDDARRLSRAGADLLTVSGDAAADSRVTSAGLAFDHDRMVTTAVRRLRRRYERAADPRRLLRPPYTMTQLRRVHEAVLDAELKRDTFNRRMAEFVQPARDADGQPLLTSASLGRPAQLFEPVGRPPRDPEAGPYPLPRSR